MVSKWKNILPLIIPKYCILLTVAFALCGNIQLHSQELNDYNKTLIWRGMQHKWTYNHRVNRLGNFVTMDNGGQAVHRSATGLGSDSTSFTSHYTYVESPDVCFKEIPITIQVNGKEGALLTKIEELYVPADPWIRDKKAYYALINGFEIRSILKSDQLELFRFLVDEVSYSKASEELKVKAHFNLVTNCRTLECPILSNKTAYELTINLLIMAFDDDNANLTTAYTARNYVWDEQIEIEDQSQQVITLGQKNNIYPEATIGIRGLGIVLDEEHWLLEMNEYVLPVEYNSETGILLSDANLKYVEWKKGMQQFAVSPFKAKFAKRKSGYALLDMNLAMVQFKNAKIKQGKSTGSMFWKGWNQDAAAGGSQKILSLAAFINGPK